MVKFMEVTRDGKLGVIREISQSDMQACPHVIMMAEHYHTSGKCRCDDPTHEEMIEWGYQWNEAVGQWE